MTTTDERLKDLEMRVDRLETWAGPGQAEAMSNSLTALRAETASFRQEVNRRLGRLETDVATLKTDVATLKTDVAALKTDVAALKTDVAALKTDMAQVKDGVQELLRRLPPAA